MSVIDRIAAALFWSIVAIACGGAYLAVVIVAAVVAGTS